MSRLQWLTERRRGIGGSDAAAILGASKFHTEWDVYVDKSGLRPLEDRDDEPLHLLLGRLLEPVVATLYEKRTGNRLLQPPGILVHPDHDCILGTPDRLVLGQERGCEIKTVNSWSRTAWGDPGTDQVPDDYLIQSQHYMGLTGFGIWDVPVLFSGARFEIYVVPRDADFIAWMFDRLTAWWRERIVNGIPPEIDGSSGASEYVRLRYPRNTEPLLIAPPEIEELAQRLGYLRQQADMIEADKTLVENKIKDAIGNAEGIEGAFGKITWKRSKDSPGTDWQAVATELSTLVDPETALEIANRHATVRPGYRRFNFKPTTGDKK